MELESEPVFRGALRPIPDTPGDQSVHGVPELVADRDRYRSVFEGSQPDGEDLIPELRTVGRRRSSGLGAGSCPWESWLPESRRREADPVGVLVLEEQLSFASLEDAAGFGVDQLERARRECQSHVHAEYVCGLLRRELNGHNVVCVPRLRDEGELHALRVARGGEGCLRNRGWVAAGLLPGGAAGLLSCDPACLRSTEAGEAHRARPRVHLCEGHQVVDVPLRVRHGDEVGWSSGHGPDVGDSVAGEVGSVPAESECHDVGEVDVSIGVRGVRTDFAVRTFAERGDVAEVGEPHVES